MSFLKPLLFLGAITTVAAKPHRAFDNGDQNWCGAVETASVTYVEGTYTVPAASLPDNGDSGTFYGNSQWVGIDGYGGYCSGLFQAGTSSYVENGQTSYYSWMEWYPAGPVNLDVAVSPGDEIYVAIQATSSTTGTVYLENKTTGRYTNQKLSAPRNAPICFKTVEWIQEDNGVPQNPYPKVDTFSMTGLAKDSNGNVVQINNNAISLNSTRSGVLQCVPSISDHTVTFQYEGSG